MRPVPKGHPARPRGLVLCKPEEFKVPDFDFQSLQDDRPPRWYRRVDWAEWGWRLGPYIATAICFVGLYFAGGQK
jgi:hypothetical protein